MKNNAKKFPLPTGEQWSRLPERVLALETAPKPKIFRATIKQIGAESPVVTEEVNNTTGATFTFGYVGNGMYSITSDIPLFKSTEKTIVNLSLGKFTVIPFYNWVNDSEIMLYTRDESLSLKDELLVNNMLTIEILD